MVLQKLKVSPSERKTFIVHMIYTSLDGIILGVLALNEFILIKALSGEDYQMSLLFQFAAIVFLFSIIFNEIQKRIEHKKRFIRIIAIITRLPLLVVFFFPEDINFSNQVIFQYIFLFIFLFYYTSSSIIIPVINLILKKNYKNENFSKYYGYSASLNKIIMLLTTFVFGLLLEYNEHYYTYIYPAIGLISIAAVFLLTKIDYTSNPVEMKVGFWVSVRKTFQNMNRIIWGDKSFRDFEIGFMMYGSAWMISGALIPIFMNNILHLNYLSMAIYYNSYNTIAIITLPFFGKLLGRMNPRKFSIYTYFTLALFLFFLILAGFFPINYEIFGVKIYLMLIFAYISYGFFAAMMALSWYIGSAFFGGENDVADYQALHLGLTGVRGMFAPFIGVGIYQFVGYTGVFGLSIIILLCATWVLSVSLKKR